MNEAVLEKVVGFGQERGLVGILTRPKVEPAVGAPHVILLNSGILHRVGANRIHVTLARQLAGVGITTLRFDLSGIGDSERRHDAASLRESVERDIADAVDFMGTVPGDGRVVLMGICSGAYDAMNAALEEPRVVGAVLVDIPGPFWGWRHVAHHLAARLFRPASWRRPVEKAIHYSRAVLYPYGVPDAMAATTGKGEYFVGARNAPTHETMAAGFAKLLNRSVRLLVIFTAGVETNYNHRSQFGSTFPNAAKHPCLSFEFFKEADHMFDRRVDRVRLLKTVLNWMQKDTFVAEIAHQPRATTPEVTICVGDI